MCIEMLLILREYKKMGRFERWRARQMFPVLGVFDVSVLDAVERLIGEHHAKHASESV